MTEKEIRDEVEFEVFINYTRGMLETEAEKYGYKGDVKKASRFGLEQFVIDKKVEERKQS